MNQKKPGHGTKNLQKKETKKGEQLSRRELEELMGCGKPRYYRGKGGAFKQY